MTIYPKIFFSMIIACLLCTFPAHAVEMAQTAYYNYAHDDAEYSVMLPEAPRVKTIWEESPDTTAYLENPPSENSALGELAIFRRLDMDTEEVFEVKITFLKAKQSFLEGLTKEKIQAMLAKQYTGTPLDNAQFAFSPGAGTLKWATFSGFTLDTHHHPAFAAIHYLTGQQSILVVQVLYSLENKGFQEYYKKLVDSITYIAP